MSWVVNSEKSNAKYYLISNITSSITNLNTSVSDIRSLVANIDYTIGNIPSGTDIRWNGCCQRAMNNLVKASTYLHQALMYTKGLSDLEWISDGDYESTDTE
ncbi:MAG: hypothetical protein LBM13_01065 [Candidatus Ancillula sp.]|jgi:hypothetical protein|nr:hypothetical protein [Candidatus Ancillula sp.]